MEDTVSNVSISRARGKAIAWGKPGRSPYALVCRKPPTCQGP